MVRIRQEPGHLIHVERAFGRIECGESLCGSSSMRTTCHRIVQTLAHRGQVRNSGAGSGAVDEWLSCTLGKLFGRAATSSYHEYGRAEKEKNSYGSTDRSSDDCPGCDAGVGIAG